MEKIDFSGQFSPSKTLFCISTTSFDSLKNLWIRHCVASPSQHFQVSIGLGPGQPPGASLRGGYTCHYSWGTVRSTAGALIAGHVHRCVQRPLNYHRAGGQSGPRAAACCPLRAGPPPPAPRSFLGPPHKRPAAPRSLPQRRPPARRNYNRPSETLKRISPALDNRRPGRLCAPRRGGAASGNLRHVTAGGDSAAAGRAQSSVFHVECGSVVRAAPAFRAIARWMGHLRRR